jgi:nucleoside-diphosphate-sugar epimerase
LQNCIRGKTYDVVFDQICYDANEARNACRIFRGLTPLYIFTSSVSVYASGANITEAAFDPKRHRFAKTVEVTQDYSEAKRQAEAAFFTDAKFRVIAARFPIVCGIDDYTSRLEFHVLGAMNGESMRFPNLHARMSFVDSRDAGRALAFLAQCPFEGPINIASSDAISMNHLMQWIEQITGCRPNLVEGETGPELSPFGLSEDWFVSTDLLQSLGHHVRPLGDWLPDLIRELFLSRKHKEAK